MHFLFRKWARNYHGLLSLLGHSVAAVNCYSLGNRKHDLSMEAVAKFSFTASQVDELSFEKGSVLNVSYRRFPLDLLVSLRCCNWTQYSFSGFRQRWRQKLVQSRARRSRRMDTKHIYYYEAPQVSEINLNLKHLSLLHFWFPLIKIRQAR